MWVVFYEIKNTHTKNKNRTKRIIFDEIKCRATLKTYGGYILRRKMLTAIVRKTHDGTHGCILHSKMLQLCRRHHAWFARLYHFAVQNVTMA